MDFIYEEEVKALREALKDCGASDSVCQFYEKAEPSEGIEINDARIWPISDLRIENEQAVPGCIIFPLGYRVIGTTVWSDVYCINTFKEFLKKFINGELPTDYYELKEGNDI